MNDCLLKLKKENQVIIDRLTIINQNNDEMDTKCAHVTTENAKIQADIGSVQIDIDNQSSWDICRQIKEVEDKLSNVKHKYNDNLKVK